MAITELDKPETLSFDWTDPLHLNTQLSEEERLVYESARAYCEERLLPRIITANREERFDREIMDEMGAQGLLGATIPEEYGRLGLRPSNLAERPVGGLLAAELEFAACFRDPGRDDRIERPPITQIIADQRCEAVDRLAGRLDEIRRDAVPRDRPQEPPEGLRPGDAVHDRHGVRGPHRL